MARPSILGNAPPTEAEVNHALECCKAVPSIREELLAMEQEMSDIRERLDKAESQNEHELYEFMLEEKEKKSQQKWEALEKRSVRYWRFHTPMQKQPLLASIWMARHSRKSGIPEGAHWA